MKTVERDHFKNYKYPGKIEVSGLGALAYTVASVDVEKNSYPARLFVKPCENAEASDVMDASQLAGFFWHGEQLIVYTQTSTFSSYDYSEKVLTELFKIEKTVKYAACISNDRWLFLCVDYLVEPENDFIVSEEFPLRLDSEGYICNTRRRAYIRENGLLTPVTPDDMNIGQLESYRDEYAVFYGSEHNGFLGDDTSSLYKIDLKTLNVTLLDGERYTYSELRTLDKNEILALRSDRKLYGDSQDHYIDRISLSDASFMRLNDDCYYNLYCNVYTDLLYGAAEKRLDSLGGDALFIATDADKTNIFRGNFEKKEITNVTRSDMVIADFRVFGEYIYMIAARRMSGPEIWRADASGARMTKMTDLNGWIDEQYHISEPSRFVFTVKDGSHAIAGYIMKPVNFEDGVKYPAILFIHGGPNSAYGGNYYHETQLMAANGYGVIFCNPRGSIGYGAEFADLRGKYYTVDYDGIMEFLDEALARCGWIDRDKLAVAGGSYGGMMTNWIITHSDRFKAAVSDCCCVNEIADYFLSDIGFSFGSDIHGGALWDDGAAAAMWDKSPIKYADNAKTPTLFIHGADDFRCSAEQSLSMFTALRYHGVPSRAIIMKGESHSLSYAGKPRNRIRRFDEILSWYKKYLGGVHE